MEFEIDQFKIFEKGFQEDLKNREILHKSQMKIDFLKQDEDLRVNSSLAIHAAQKSPAFAFNRESHIKNAEQAIKEKTARLEEQKTNYMKSRLDKDSDELATFIYGTPIIRSEWIERAKEHNRNISDPDKPEIDKLIQNAYIKEQGENRGKFVIDVEKSPPGRNKVSKEFNRSNELPKDIEIQKE